MKPKTIRFFAIGLLVFPVACRQDLEDASAIQIGSLRGEVRAQVGQPQRTQEFRLPEAPFFGPQEGLAGLIPPGTLVEEWVYTLDNDELYVWFAAEEGDAVGEWRVIETGRYPMGAVF